MADVVSPSPKKGFRARLGLRSRPSDSSLPRKRLAKKGQTGDYGGFDDSSSTIAPSIATTSDRNRTPSYTASRRSSDTLKEGDIPDMYSDVASSAPHTFRENPYAAVHLGTDLSRPPSYVSNITQDDGPNSLERPRTQSRANVLRKAPPPSIARLHQDLIDKDTGERKDLTDYLHSLSYDEVPAAGDEYIGKRELMYDPDKPDGTASLAALSPDIWDHITDYLSPVDTANLWISCKTLHTKLGRSPGDALQFPENRQDRIDFLIPMHGKLPYHLFCFPCMRYHLRLSPGSEGLKAPNVLNPLFDCPQSTNMLNPPARLRLTENRLLPFTFVQLMKNHWAHGEPHGITTTSQARRYKDQYSDWSHETRYHVHRNGHVMMRVKSQVFVYPGMTLAAKRLLLYSRSDYTPYFSVCAHWKHGVLMDQPKCALGHIPVRTYNAVTQYAKHRALGVTHLCEECRPMRRCPECPTEYLFELNISEDKNEPRNSTARFKQALIVTRWSDLGPGRSPLDKEWAAVTGTLEGYDSNTEIGNRAVSGIFEAAFTDTTPGQRMLSMNPTGTKRAENDHSWY